MLNGYNLSSLAQKVFYQLVAIEEYMKIMHIKYSRDFHLNVKEVSKILKYYGTLVINHSFLLNLNNIKKSLGYIPLTLKSNEFYFSNPLGEVKKKRGRFLVYIGNKLITTLKPQYFKMSKNCQDKYKVIADDKEISLSKASEFYVNDDFKVIKSKKNRVNVIGYYKKDKTDESQIPISLKNLNKYYSIDNNNKIYRIEFYNNDEFCSMLLVHFK